MLTIVFTSQNFWNDEPGGATVAILPCAILLAVGIAFFIVYAIGKKTWAKELAELDAKKPEE